MIRVLDYANAQEVATRLSENKTEKVLDNSIANALQVITRTLRGIEALINPRVDTETLSSHAEIADFWT